MLPVGARSGRRYCIYRRDFLGRQSEPAPTARGLPHPFATPYRVINWHACNGRWNDPHHHFDHKDLLWCPRHAGTPRQFECTRLITAEQVKSVIRTSPGFGQFARADNRTPAAASVP